MKLTSRILMIDSPSGVHVYHHYPGSFTIGVALSIVRSAIDALELEACSVGIDLLYGA